MRLPQVKRDIGVGKRALFGFIGTVARMKLPDVVYVMQHRPELFGRAYSAYADGTMRDPSQWSVGERELCASFAASLQGCEFSRAAHGAVASIKLGEDVVRAVWADHESAPVSERLRAALRFTRVLTLEPSEIDAEHVRALFAAGVTRAGVEDLIDVVTAFNIITRVADALEFDMPSWENHLRGAKVMLKRGYK